MAQAVSLPRARERRPRRRRRRWTRVRALPPRRFSLRHSWTNKSEPYAGWGGGGVGWGGEGVITAFRLGFRLSPPAAPPVRVPMRSNRDRAVHRGTNTHTHARTHARTHTHTHAHALALAASFAQALRPPQKTFGAVRRSLPCTACGALASIRAYYSISNMDI